MRKTGAKRSTSGLAVVRPNAVILQRFHKGKRVRVDYYDRKRDDDASDFDGRVRLCPYFFVTATSAARRHPRDVAPADKRLIHGMTDAIMAPCAVRESGY